MERTMRFAVHVSHRLRVFSRVNVKTICIDNLCARNIKMVHGCLEALLRRRAPKRAAGRSARGWANEKSAISNCSTGGVVGYPTGRIGNDTTSPCVKTSTCRICLCTGREASEDVEGHYCRTANGQISGWRMVSNTFCERRPTQPGRFCSLYALLLTERGILFGEEPPVFLLLVAKTHCTQTVNAPELSLRNTALPF